MEVLLHRLNFLDFASYYLLFRFLQDFLNGNQYINWDGVKKRHRDLFIQKPLKAQLAGAVEYTNCIFADR